MLNFAVTGRLKGHPRLDIMQKVLQQLVRRNDILRTRYIEREDFTEQQVLDSYVAEIAYEDFDAAFEACVLDMRSCSMDIEEAEAMRVKLCRLSHVSYSLAFVFYHICVDNGSTKSSTDQFFGVYDVLWSRRPGIIISVPSS